MRRTRLLIVDDEADVRLGLRRFLQARGYEVEEAGDCREAEAAFAASPPDAAIIDEQLPDGSGVDLLPRLRALHPGASLIVLTGYGSIELAVRAIKEGAEQFLTKPVDAQAILVLIERLMEGRRNRQKQLASRPREGEPPIDPFMGTSAAMTQLQEEAKSLIDSDLPVLIQGETGTGKGVLARWLHENGPRQAEAFVDLNCAGLSRELLDSEIFGHEAGAFTGADRAKQGLLDVAHRGTLFLDEIGDMDLALQPKLLKVIEEQRFRRLGDVRERSVDVRLMAATHQDLGQLMQEKRFREDLYFRISALPLAIPPLRERREDIQYLARHFLMRFAGERGRRAVALTADALATLQGYGWPGNIRELRNVLERALLIGGREVISSANLGVALTAPAAAPRETPAATLDEVERDHVIRVFELEGRRVEPAARRLGISVSSLYERLRKYGVSTRRGSPETGESSRK